MDLNTILLAPVVTEKSTQAQQQKKYAFMVHPQANKIQISQAVEQGYGVQVKSVRIVPVVSKIRVAGRGRVITKRPARKKAIVTLASKDALDFNKIKLIK